MSTRVNLTDLRRGDWVKVLGYYPGESVYRARLCLLGLVPGAIFQVMRFAPLGDPLHIKLRNSALCIRKQEGNVLQLQRIEYPQ